MASGLVREEGGLKASSCWISREGQVGLPSSPFPSQMTPPFSVIPALGLILELFVVCASKELLEDSPVFKAAAGWGSCPGKCDLKHLPGFLPVLVWGLAL